MSEISYYQNGVPMRTDVVNKKMKRIALGKKLREARLKAGFSQREAWEALEASASYISAVERGHCEVSLEKLYELCSLYNENPHDFDPRLVKREFNNAKRDKGERLRREADEEWEE